MSARPQPFLLEVPTALPELTAGDDPATELHRALALAKERERRRWARNLHDETLQALGTLRRTLAELAVAGTDDREAIGMAVAGLDEQIDSLRRLVDGLRPTLLDQLGLAPALVALVERARRASPARIDVRLALAGHRRAASEDLELAVYRIVQEALNNCANHSAARTVRVAVGRQSDRMGVLVADDGLGFDTEATMPGAGLTGMGEWASLARGHLEVRSRPGAGTAVEVEFPLEG